MKNLSVIIIDLEKLTEKQREELFGNLLYWARVEENSYKKLTDAIEQIQEEELQEENQ